MVHELLLSAVHHSIVTIIVPNVWRARRQAPALGASISRLLPLRQLTTSFEWLLFHHLRLATLLDHTPI